MPNIPNHLLVSLVILLLLLFIKYARWHNGRIYLMERKKAEDLIAERELRRQVREPLMMQNPRPHGPAAPDGYIVWGYGPLNHLAFDEDKWDVLFIIDTGEGASRSIWRFSGSDGDTSAWLCLRKNSAIANRNIPNRTARA